MAIVLMPTLNPEERDDLLFGLFNVLVMNEYIRTLELGGAAEAPAPAARQVLIAEAIRQVARYFPVSIQGRFVEMADEIAASMLGATTWSPG